MTTITLELPDEKAARVRNAAQLSGVPIEEFVERTLDTALARQEAVETTFQMVLKKNEELYRRLAR
jgi:hypothetical protein